VELVPAEKQEMEVSKKEELRQGNTTQMLVIPGVGGLNAFLGGRKG
jgi:hypothetical protein